MMIALRRMVLGVVGGVAATMVVAPASAATTTLDFSGNICGPTGTAPCSNSSVIGQNYGDGVGVDVSYRGANNATGATTETSLRHWGSGYGDLAHVAWTDGGSSANFSEITFTALAGYELTLLGFDGGCYQNRASCRSFPYLISQIGGGTVASGTLTPAAGGHDSTSFTLGYSSAGYVLRWGPDGYDGGLSNIRFDVRAITAVGAVPEPGTWAMMIAGFGMAGGAIRRRRRPVAQRALA